MRYTFFKQDYTSAEAALRKAKALVKEVLDVPAPLFSMAEGDEGWCVAYEYDDGGSAFRTIILVNFNSEQYHTVQGFIVN